MAKSKKQDWWDDENAEEILYVSKSEIKRDAEALKKLGEKLVNLTATNLAKIPLDSRLQDAITLTQRLQREAKRRQLQYIGKLLRNVDVEPIQEALDKVENKHQHQQAILHKIERQREVLLAKDDALTLFLEQYPTIDIQHLRMLIRGAKKEQSQNKLGKNYREIFVVLKHVMLDV